MVTKAVFAGQEAQDALAIRTIRTLSMDMVQAANSGHPGTPMALAPLGWALFRYLRKHDPSTPGWWDRDRFVLSCGHASALQYALLHLGGYDLGLDELKDFRQWGSRTPGHPEYGHTPGVEITTGPLGQGIATAVGMAMAERHMAARFNRPGHRVVDHTTWVIASDGDLMEGISSEAASIAGHLGLGKLVVFWDDNHITIDGRTDLSFTEDVVARFASQGWHTLEVEDGNDLPALVLAGQQAKQDPRPTLVRVRTIIGDPAPNKKDTSGAHGAPLGADEVAATKEILGAPSEAFVVPEELGAVRESVLAEGTRVQGEWQATWDAYAAAHGDLAEAFEQAMAGEFPADWKDALPGFPVDAKGMATRKASGNVVAAMSKVLPNLVGGSADLAGSNLSTQPGLAAFGAAKDGDFSGGGEVPRNVHFGVREHAMGAICNGMALHGGVVAYGATFLVFSDYMRPAIRLAALMKLPVKYIFTHDSIGLGEDGPTHQPVEHVAALRLIPGLQVFRPGDANETREAWEAAMAYTDGPSALVLTRQALPTLDRVSTDGVRRGAYVVHGAYAAKGSDAVNGSGAPEVQLLATGSEVHLAVQACDALAEKGVAAQVVSLPCWELLTELPQEKQRELFPAGVKARVVVEAGSRMGWERWATMGLDSARVAYVTMDGFGASAPAGTLFREFGFTRDGIVQAALNLLGRG